MSDLLNKTAVLNKEIAALKTKLADRYYEMWIAENIDFDEIDQLCQQILDRETFIKNLRESEERAVAEKAAADKALAEKAAETGAPAAVLYCVQCGNKNSSGARFCTGCGASLQ